MVRKFEGVLLVHYIVPEYSGSSKTQQEKKGHMCSISETQLRCTSFPV